MGSILGKGLGYLLQQQFLNWKKIESIARDAGIYKPEDLISLINTHSPIKRIGVENMYIFKIIYDAQQKDPNKSFYEIAKDNLETIMILQGMDPRLIHWWRMGDNDRDSINEVGAYDFVVNHAIADSAYSDFGEEMVVDSSEKTLDYFTPFLYLNQTILSSNTLDHKSYKLTFDARVSNGAPSEAVVIGVSADGDSIDHQVDCTTEVAYTEETFIQNNNFNGITNDIFNYRCEGVEGFPTSAPGVQPLYADLSDCLAECTTDCTQEFIPMTTADFSFLDMQLVYNTTSDGANDNTKYIFQCDTNPDANCGDIPLHGSDTQFSYTNLIQISEIKRNLIVMGGLRKIEESYKIDHSRKKIKYIKGQLTETLQYDGAIYDDLTAHLYLRLLNIQTDEEITLNVLERGKIRQKKFIKTISSPDTIKIKEKKEKDKFELFFKDNSKEILKVIQNVNGREFVWENL